MVVASGEKQQCLTRRIPALDVTLQQYFSNQLGSMGATWLPCSLGWDAITLKHGGEAANLGRFSSSLPALDGDEFSASVQCRLPQIR